MILLKEQPTQAEATMSLSESGSLSESALLEASTAMVRRRVRMWLICAQWILIPAMVFGVGEYSVKQWCAPRPLFWDQARPAARTGRLDAVFIGSSRVAAAIDPAIVASAVTDASGQPVLSVNVGTGFSTLQEHRLGLRNYLESHADAGRGLVVFIEATNGIPEDSLPSQSWHSDQRPELLVQVLQPGDLPALWQSKESLEERLRFTFRCLTGSSAISRESERIGRGILAKGTTRLNTLFQKLDRSESATGAGLPGRMADQPDLSTAGGIRVDDEGLRLTRQAAAAWARSQILDQRPRGPWERKVVAEIIELVQSHGGRVVFFNAPLHPTHAAVFATPVRETDRTRFAEFARSRGCELLSCDFPTGDDDFPDIFHLRQSRAADYTRVLCREWNALRAED